MKRAITLAMVALIALAGVTGAAVTGTQFSGDTDGSVAVDGQNVTVTNGTTDYVNVTHDVSYDGNNTTHLNITVHDDVMKNTMFNDSSRVSSMSMNNSTKYMVNVTNNTSQVMVMVELSDEFQNLSANSSNMYMDAYMYEMNGSTTSYNWELTAGSSGDFSGFSFFGEGSPVPDLFQQFGDLGVFLFYALIAGSVILGLAGIYMLYQGNMMSKKGRTAAYAGISVASIGSVLGQTIVGPINGYVVLGVFGLLLAVVLYIYKMDGSVATHPNTQYID